MNSPSSRLVETVRPQLFVIVIVVTAGLFSCFGLVPKPEMLAAKLKTLFEQYGILLVAPISFAENLVGMNIYFPGSIVILTSMTLASGDPSRAVSTFLAIIIPSFLAHQLNFALGVRSGAKGHSPAFDSDAIATSNRSGIRLATYLFTLWHPHFTALTAFRAGSLQMPYVLFISRFTPVFLCWNLFWASLMYSIGPIAEREGNLMPFFYFYLAVWLGWGVYNHYHRKPQSMSR